MNMIHYTMTYRNHRIVIMGADDGAVFIHVFTPEGAHIGEVCTPAMNRAAEAVATAHLWIDNRTPVAV